jgi:hypothetical protein
MKKNMLKRCVFILTSVLSLTVITCLVVATPTMMASLPDKGANFGCGTCHVKPGGGGALNLFGADYKKIGVPAGDKYTDALASLDSDGDGYTNAQEFNANPVTNPSDPQSHPAQSAVKPKDKNHTTWGKIKSQS